MICNQFRCNFEINCKSRVKVIGLHDLLRFLNSAHVQWTTYYLSLLIIILHPNHDMGRRWASGFAPPWIGKLIRTYSSFFSSSADVVVQIWFWYILVIWSRYCSQSDWKVPSGQETCLWPRTNFIPQALSKPRSTESLLGL